MRSAHGSSWATSARRLLLARCGARVAVSQNVCPKHCEGTGCEREDRSSPPAGQPPAAGRLGWCALSRAQQQLCGGDVGHTRGGYVTLPDARVERRLVAGLQVR